MKNLVKKIISLFILPILFIFGISGCTEYFEDPLVDKNTGENINLILIDFNFFSTRITFKLEDAKDGSAIVAPAKITVSGKNGNDIVNFSGLKKPNFSLSQGVLELTADPGVAISTASPFEFVVTAEAEGYNTLVKGITFQSEGIKTVELMLSKKSDEQQTQLNGNLDVAGGDTTFYFGFVPEIMKSAAVADKPYEISYSTSIASLKKFTDINGRLLFNSSQEIIDAYNRDPKNFMKVTFSAFSHYPSGIDRVITDGNVRNALFQKLETGKLVKLTVSGKDVYALNGGNIQSVCQYTASDNPGIFGFARFKENYWEFSGTNAVYETLGFQYTVAKASTETLCEKGSSITFKSAIQSSFSIDADVFDKEGKFIISMNFKGKFPQTFAVENVPAKAVKIKFRSNNSSFSAIPPLEIDNFCSGSFEVHVPPAEGYVEYQIVLKAICPDNPQVAIAPSYNAEVRQKNSANLWQSFSMQSGVVDILGIPGKEYEIRLLWDGEWEYSSYETSFDTKGNYTGAAHKDAKISSKIISDGRIQIIVEKIFEQNICNDLGW